MVKFLWLSHIFFAVCLKQERKKLVSCNSLIYLLKSLLLYSFHLSVFIFIICCCSRNQVFCPVTFSTLGFCWLHFCKLFKHVLQSPVFPVIWKLDLETSLDSGSIYYIVSRPDLADFKNDIDEISVCISKESWKETKRGIL